MARQIRITGLIRLAEGVRRELSVPISPGQRDCLQKRVCDSLERIEQIARENGTRVDRLPAPSWRAVQFLKRINWEKIPVSENHAQAMSAPIGRRVTWTGLSGFVERAMDRLSEPLSEAELGSVRLSLERMSRQMEGTIERQKLQPDELVPLARSLRGWLAFFSRAESLRMYAEAVAAAGRVLEPEFSRQRRFRPPLRVQFRPMTGIYKLRSTARGSILWLPAAAVGFEKPDVEVLAQLIFHGDREARQRIIERMTGEAFQTIQAELESLSGIVERSRGAVYDLGDSFDRVNAQYFRGSMARPRLTWSASFTGRKFGHYDWLADTVMVSRTLDAATVPQFVMDYIMYHELLHKKHGITWTNGRGYAHTAEFYREEKQFERYTDADAVLGKLARGAQLRKHFD